MTGSTEQHSIREPIGVDADGMRTGKADTLRQAFHEQAILCRYLGDDLTAGPIAGSYAWVERNPSPDASGSPFTCELPGIELTGRVATAKVREADAHGVVIDHFHLLKVRDTWTIVSTLWDMGR